MSVEVFNVLLAGVKQKIDNLENDDKIRLIIDYIKKSGSLELDVYEFYKNIETLDIKPRIKEKLINDKISTFIDNPPFHIRGPTAYRI